MKKFTILKGIAAVMPDINIDTDAIIPKQFLKTIHRKGLGKSLFYNERYTEGYNKNADFILVDINNSHSIPLFDPITHLVFGAGRSDVTDVFVSGKHVVENKKIGGLDIEKIHTKVRQLAPSIKASLE